MARRAGERERNHNCMIDMAPPKDESGNDFVQLPNGMWISQHEHTADIDPKLFAIKQRLSAIRSILGPAPIPPSYSVDMGVVQGPTLDKNGNITATQAVINTNFQGVNELQSGDFQLLLKEYDTNFWKVYSELVNAGQ